MSRRLDNHVWLKREDLQPVFSFKLRGAYNKMSRLDDAQLALGVVAASAGNHAQGLAMAAQKINGKARLTSARLLPNGGEIRLPSREKTITSPMAVPAYAAPTPLSWKISVIRIAMKPSRKRPATATAAQTKTPSENDSVPIPKTVIRVATINSFLRAPNRSDNMAMGMAAIRLTP